MYNRTHIYLEQLIKGSTCALTESILRSCGIKTGFFSSPHLIDETERIQLCGAPITKDKFAKYFWKVYDLLDNSREHGKDMPAYFKFLTIMAFHIFLTEKVDVAIIEVGIGGEYDCTNVIRNTKTAGITSLGLDHTQLLGDTLPEIAWQKAGIIKPNCNVFTSVQQNECIEVLQNRSIEKNAHLHWVPEFSSYNWRQPVKSNNALLLNGSLAIQLSYDWLKNHSHKVRNQEIVHTLNKSNEMCLEIFEEVQSGLEKCIWPGRFQCIVRNNMRLYVDGAHTMESIQLCVEWFKGQTKDSKSKNYVIFNVTGNRNFEHMLELLNDSVNFKMALFTPNSANYDSWNYNPKKLDKQILYAEYWQKICGSSANPINTHMNGNGPNHENALALTNESSKVFPCISDAFQYLDEISAARSEGVNVLVTGSLYLIGSVHEYLRN